MKWQLLNLFRLLFVPKAPSLLVYVGSSWNFSRAHRAKRYRLGRSSSFSSCTSCILYAFNLSSRAKSFHTSVRVAEKGAESIFTAFVFPSQLWSLYFHHCVLNVVNSILSNNECWVLRWVMVLRIVRLVGRLC